MFVSWMQHAKAEHGISSINNAMSDPVVHGNNMESFTFAETFKWVLVPGTRTLLKMYS